MKVKTLTVSSLGIAGLVTAGLLTFPNAALAGTDNQALKRDDDTPDVVLTHDDDDDDTNEPDSVDTTNGTTNTNESDINTNTVTNTTGNTNSNDGSAVNDDSRSKLGKDWTQDGPGDTVRDWSVNDTNDGSRHNTLS